MVLGQHQGKPSEVQAPHQAKFLIVPVHNLGSDVKIGIEKQILKDAGLR
jgi:predicted RNA binding protein YcfA (HicA-like mRNA interferase family)